MAWADLIERARRSLSDPDFENRERIYKLEIAEAIRRVLELAERGEDWTTALRRTFGHTYGAPGFRSQYNLSRFSQHQWLYKLEGEPADEARAVLARMRGPGDAAERFASFADLASRYADKGGAQPGGILAVGSVLNMGTDPEHLPPMKTTAFKSAEEHVGYSGAPDDIIEAYSHHLRFADECETRFREASLPIRDRLDVQGVLWEWLNPPDEPRGVPSGSALHILQRWSLTRDPETIEKHREVAEEHGAVWWGRLGDPEGRAAIGAARLEELQAQLNADTPTYVFLHRTGEVWGTRLAEIRSERPTDELELIPEYYRDVLGEHHLWLKLRGFESLAPDYAETHLIMDGSDDAESVAQAFRGQQSFLYVRLRPGDGGGEPYAEPPFAEILASVREAGMKISEDELRRYHVSLRIREFVILAGISGSGKTWLTELYAQAIGANHHLAAVAPNWTTNEDLLGYLNPLTDRYQHTSFSEYLREAAAEWERATGEGREPTPFHVTLDEMNLARVEYYFAKFLSAMEVRARSGTATLELAPGHRVRLTPNLRFSGTVNVDETTHVFADKVYDRAQLVTLSPSRDAIRSHMDGMPYRDTLIRIWDAVHEVAPFGYRVLDEVRAYVRASDDLGVGWEEALDEQLMQKVLPKLKGADQRVGSCLSDLVELTGTTFPLTHAKATAMRDEFTRHGFASYF